jgi:hypothetical protein
MERQILWAGRALAAERVALLQGSVDAGLPDFIRHCGLDASEEPEAEGDDENFCAFSISYFELQFLFHALSVRGINSRASISGSVGTPKHRLTRNLNARA